MSFGEKFKRIRLHRGMTQAQVGEPIGLQDVRIRQYESGNRTPKLDTIQKLAKILNCNYRSLYDSSLYAAEDVMYTLFELDEHYEMPLFEITENNDSKVCIGFESFLLNEFLLEWKKKKDELEKGIITQEEYFEWKINWPNPE